MLPRLDIELAPNEMQELLGGRKDRLIPAEGSCLWRWALLQTCACHSKKSIQSVTSDFQLVFETPICYLSPWHLDKYSTCVPITVPSG